ncbi:TerB family tellurite resistance protein [Pontibacter sp. SGAir0037]|uniref:TerB family tellurite resistance protein n=1 Tax=Pontibacter sp. SGAir0037 TaxID=2571030 RepID=UPI0010CCB96E|nr:TerB family tellurite resistance protein [Pontibacter sp. SGAir0037]QCR21185.1 TerB family tellurite resistance protein [Pontibacter sp. SGAir0037]
MFGFFESEETKKVKSHITNLGALAKADGHVDPNEISFIISIGQKHGMSESEVRALLSDSTHVNPQVPSNDLERFDQIYDLVEMMLADGIVDESEMKFCIHMASRLGYSKSIVGVLVNKISMGVKDGYTREFIRQEAQSIFNN